MDHSRGQNCLNENGKKLSKTNDVFKQAILFLENVIKDVHVNSSLWTVRAKFLKITGLTKRTMAKNRVS